MSASACTRLVLLLGCTNVQTVLQLLAQTTESIAVELQTVEEAVTDLRSQVSKSIPSATTMIVPSVPPSTGMC